MGMEEGGDMTKEDLEEAAEIGSCPVCSPQWLEVSHQILLSLERGILDQQAKKKKETILLTISAYSPARAAFSRINKAFIQYYKEKTGQDVR